MTRKPSGVPSSRAPHIIIEGERKKERKSYREDRESDVYIVDRRERQREKTGKRQTGRGKRQRERERVHLCEH